jgi:hypothetical protein
MEKQNSPADPYSCGRRIFDAILMIITIGSVSFLDKIPIFASLIENLKTKMPYIDSILRIAFAVIIWSCLYFLSDKLKIYKTFNDWILKKER